MPSNLWVKLWKEKFLNPYLNSWARILLKEKLSKLWQSLKRKSANALLKVSVSTVKTTTKSTNSWESLDSILLVFSNVIPLFISVENEDDYKMMTLGVAHGLSRYKLKFSAEKVDIMIIQAVSLLDELDKEINNYTMRLKEWYGWHFP